MKAVKSLMVQLFICSISSLPLEALILAGNGMCDDFNDISYPESLKKLDLAFTNVSDTPQRFVTHTLSVRFTR